MPAVTTWLSFAEPDPPHYLGAVFVDAPNFALALMAANLAGVNPGGECLGIAIPHMKVPKALRAAFHALPRLTLLSVDQLRTLGPLVNLDGEPR